MPGASDERSMSSDRMYLIGREESAETHDLRRFLLRNHVPYQWVDLDRDPLVRFLVNGEQPTASRWPVCVFPDGTRLEAPSRMELARALALPVQPQQEEYDLAIVGAGPAGLTAAVYAASEGLRTVVIEREAPGGQAGTTSRIENYPGFPDGIGGMELMERSHRQARRFGAEFILVNEVAAFNPSRRSPFELYLLDDTSLLCHTGIIATGATYRLLDVPGIDELIGRGVYYGTAMGQAQTYTGRDVYVVGGGNSAGQTALHLAEYARSVRLLVRGSSLQQSMSQYLIDLLNDTENVEIWTRSQVVRAEGDSRLTALVINQAGNESSLPADGLFILIGQRPATDWLEGIMIRDRRGFLVTGPTLLGDGDGSGAWILPRDPLPLETNAPGIFAAGDVRHGAVNRVAWAVGEAAMAVQLVHQYLGKLAERDLKVLQDMPQDASAATSRINFRI